MTLLNNDLNSKNITDSPLCRCGSVENTHRCFFQCSYYNEQRATLLNTVAHYQTVTLKLLFFGNGTLPRETNISVFNKVQKYKEPDMRWYSILSQKKTKPQVPWCPPPPRHAARTASPKANCFFLCHSDHFYLAFFHDTISLQTRNFIFYDDLYMQISLPQTPRTRTSVCDDSVFFFFFFFLRKREPRCKNHVAK